MKTYTKVLFICLFIVPLLTSCTGKVDINEPTNPTNDTIKETTQTPEVTQSLTFEQIVAVKPNYFVGGGREFQVKSSEANYYGEITVGKRSYVDGASNDLQGTYALFVSDANGGSAGLDIVFADAGFSYKNQFYGAKEGDAVKYPFDTNDIYSSLSDCHYNRNQSLVINKLSYLHIDWRKSQSVFSEKTFNMLAVVISKDEAVSYVQDGVLPDCLKGVTVTGLDKIFVSPKNKTQVSKGAGDVIEIMTPKYGDVGCFSEGMAAVSTSVGSDGRWGFIDDSGKEVIPPQYIQAKPFLDGLAWVQTTNGLWGCIDKTGKEVIPFGTYIYLRSFSDGFASVVNSDDCCGVIDTTGKVVVPLAKYNDIEPFSEGLAVVKLNNKKGVIDTTGKEVIGPILTYSKIEPFSNGMAAVLTSDNKWGFIDNTGKEIISPKYDIALSFSEGLAAVNRGGWGFVDKSGNEIIPLNNPGTSYNGESFSDGTVAVVASIDASNDKKKKVIDTKGKQIASLEKYSLVDPFVDGLATCNEGVIDKQGVLLAANVEGKYRVERGKPHASNIVPISNDYKYGFIKIIKK